MQDVREKLTHSAISWSISCVTLRVRGVREQLSTSNSDFPDIKVHQANSGVDEQSPKYESVSMACSEISRTLIGASTKNNQCGVHSDTLKAGKNIQVLKGKMKKASVTM